MLGQSCRRRAELCRQSFAVCGICEDGELSEDGSSAGEWVTEERDSRRADRAKDEPSASGRAVSITASGEHAQIWNW